MMRQRHSTEIQLSEWGKIATAGEGMFLMKRDVICYSVLGWLMSFVFVKFQRNWREILHHNKNSKVYNQI